MAKRRANKNRSARERLRKEKLKQIEREQDQNLLFGWMMKAVMFVVAFAVINLAALMWFGKIHVDALAVLLTTVGLVIYGVYCLFSFLSSKDKSLRNLSIELFLCAAILIGMRIYLM